MNAGANRAPATVIVAMMCSQLRKNGIHETIIGMQMGPPEFESVRRALWSESERTEREDLDYDGMVPFRPFRILPEWKEYRSLRALRSNGQSLMLLDPASVPQRFRREGMGAIWQRTLCIDAVEWTFALSTKERLWVWETPLNEWWRASLLWLREDQMESHLRHLVDHGAADIVVDAVQSGIRLWPAGAIAREIGGFLPEGGLLALLLECPDRKTREEAIGRLQELN